MGGDGLFLRLQLTGLLEVKVPDGPQPGPFSTHPSPVERAGIPSVCDPPLNSRKCETSGTENLICVILLGCVGGCRPIDRSSQASGSNHRRPRGMQKLG